jgi:hypothetical protein
VDEAILVEEVDATSHLHEVIKGFIFLEKLVIANQAEQAALCHVFKNQIKIIIVL